MAQLNGIGKKTIIALRSPKGRDVMMFLLFVIISAGLWAVLSLNEEEQFDLRMPVRITHVPDSITLISTGPETLSTSITATGTTLMRMTLGKVPTVDIDFRAFRSGDYIHLTSTDLKGLVRTATGGSQVTVVYPDSLTIPFTTSEGFRMPITIDARVVAGPQSALVGQPRISTDSVTVYLAPDQMADHFEAVTTEPIRMLGINKTTTRRVKLIGPAHARVIPDSVDITFEAEPLIFKSRKVVIEPINVPQDMKLITFPAQTDVFYMLPTSQYKAGGTHFRVVADFTTIKPGDDKVQLTITDVSQNLRNVHLTTDSAEYIIERHAAEK